MLCAPHAHRQAGWRYRTLAWAPASQGGKLKTALQTLAVALYLCPLPGWMALPSFLVMLAAAFVTVLPGIQYLIDGRRENQ